MENNSGKALAKREEWIDLLRALAMFLVIMGHTYDNKVFYQIVNPIKMPLFFFLSGLFISLDKKFLDFLKGILYRVVVPWLIFSLFPLYLAKYVVGGDINGALGYAKDFFLGFKFWFITCFIITQLLCYGLYHLLRKNLLITLAVTLGCFYLGIALKEVSFFEIWAMNTALTGTFFIMLGKVFYSYKSITLDKFVMKSLVFVISLLVYCGLVAVTIYYYPGQTMDFHNTQYYNTIICLALIAAGISWLIFLTSKLKSNFITRMIAIMGQNTLVVYLLNGIVIAKVIQLYKKVGFGANGLSLWESALLTAVACAISTVISVLCGKFCPALIGKKKKK